MKASDRTIMIALGAVGLLAAFWLLAVSPKRSELSELNGKIETVRSSISSLESEASAGEAARSDFDRNYARMVVLGKAVPSGHEEGELIVGLDRIGKQAGVSFRSIQLAPAPAIAPGTGPELTQTDQNAEAEQADAEQQGAEDPSPATTATAPTEAAASLLPLGAAVGPAGLGVMAWDVEFLGGFFEINKVLAAIDRSVQFVGDGAKTEGRLVTVDGFTMSVDKGTKDPTLETSLQLRTYVTPKDEGVTLGATTQGPATTPVSDGEGS